MVDESLGDAAEVFEGCVDGLGGVACGVGVVEVGQDVCGSSFEGSSELSVGDRVLVGGCG